MPAPTMTTGAGETSLWFGTALLIRDGDVVRHDHEARDAAEALQGRLAAILAARSELSLRFTGAAAAPWTELEPAALRGDPGPLRLVCAGLSASNRSARYRRR